MTPSRRDALFWQARDPWFDIYAMVDPAFDLNAFRLRNDDGSESGATWKAAENTAASIEVSANVAVRLRAATQETAGGAINNVDIDLQYRLNAGAWVNVDGSTTVVSYRTSSFIANQTPTTSQLITPTGTFVAGAFIDADASLARVTFTGNDHTENEWSLELLAADLSHGDVLEFRTLTNGTAQASYSQTPTINVTISAPTTAPVLTSPAKTDTTIDLSWTTANGATSYRLERFNDPVWDTIYTGANLTFQDTGLIPGEPYTYRVVGVNNTGDGPYSNSLGVTTDAKAVSAGTEATVNTVSEGAGVKDRQEGSSSTVEITVETGTVGLYHASGGSEATTNTTVETGTRTRLVSAWSDPASATTEQPITAEGGSTTTVETSVETSVATQRSAGSDAAVEVVTEGAGFPLETLFGGSEASVELPTEGQGTGNHTGASAATVELVGEAAGTKLGTGGATPDVLLVVDAQGSPAHTGSSASMVEVFPESGTTAGRQGTSELSVVVDETSGFTTGRIGAAEGSIDVLLETLARAGFVGASETTVHLISEGSGEGLENLWVPINLSAVPQGPYSILVTWESGEPAGV